MIIQITGSNSVGKTYAVRQILASPFQTVISVYPVIIERRLGQRSTYPSGRLAGTAMNTACSRTQTSRITAETHSPNRLG